MDQAAARRMRLLEILREESGGREIGALAEMFQVDERTVRRDVEHLQELLMGVQGIEMRRGTVLPNRTGFSAGYFADQLGLEPAAKRAIAQAVVNSLSDNLAIALTAGSTTYAVAQEIRRAAVQQERPRNLIAFTNSLPALLEFIAAGISTGILGEVYNADDCAFHSHEFHSAFQPNIAIVGASGIVAAPASGTLDLFSHRAEEAAFLKQLLKPVPEIFIAADAAKIGRRHPWSFSSGGVLTGKRVRLFTSALTPEQREPLQMLAAQSSRTDARFTFEEVTP
jgi:DeoR/GlpR family transcriptional regulator of sugar metabolism